MTNTPPTLGVDVTSIACPPLPVELRVDSTNPRGAEDDIVSAEGDDDEVGLAILTHYSHISTHEVSGGEVGATSRCDHFSRLTKRELSHTSALGKLLGDEVAVSSSIEEDDTLMTIYCTLIHE
jgi:hypothetical protein